MSYYMRPPNYLSFVIAILGPGLVLWGLGIGPASTANAQEAGDPVPNAESEWRELITVSITDPTSTHYLWINEELSYTASASCEDQFSNDNGATWINYAVDTASPPPTITWSATYGSFSSATGSTTTYLAPDGSAVNYEIFDTITAGAITDGNDIYGAPATIVADPTTIPATQPVAKIHVTVNQANGGNVTGHYTANPIPPDHGGIPPGSGITGWMTPNHPAGVSGFYGGTELTGTRTDPNYPYTGLFWQQTVGCQSAGQINGGALPNPLPVTTQPGTPDITKGATAGGGGPPENMTGPLYLFDAPGYDTGVADNFGIAAGVTAYGQISSLATCVVDNNSKPVSDTCTWSVSFTLGLVAPNPNIWTATAHSP